jgi:hypothetical protein
MLRLTVKRGHLVRSPRLTSPAIDVNMTHTHKRQTAMFVSTTFRAILEHFFLWLFHASPLRFVFFMRCTTASPYITALQSTLLVNTRRAIALFISTRLLFRSLPHILDCHFFPISSPKISEICRDQKESSLLSSAYSIYKILQTFSLPEGLFIMTLFKYLLRTLSNNYICQTAESI